jgi:hypothetical protein
MSGFSDSAGGEPNGREPFGVQLRVESSRVGVTFRVEKRFIHYAVIYNRNFSECKWQYGA